VKKRVPSLPPQVGAKPIVAIVGRPNVGKSTLFNRLAGVSLAIVEDQPGVTRDRNYADTDFFGVPVTIVDTGGFDPEPGDPVTDLTREQVQLAVEEADAILCVFDGRTALTNADMETVRLLRRSGKPVVFAANKVDAARYEAAAMEAYQLGLEELTMISAAHGRGVNDLVDRIAAVLPDMAEEAAEETPEGTIRVALIGRPNAGKSSLINKLLGHERMLTNDQPGTTRDSIDSRFVHDEQSYVLIDTAGLRRRSRIADRSERHAVFSAIRALQRAHVAILLLDAQAGAAEQDAKVAGLAVDRGCALLVAGNKWDLVRGQEAADAAGYQAQQVLTFLPYVPFVRVSAKTGRGVDRLLATVKRIAEEHNRRVGTGELNRFFEEMVTHKPPPLKGGRPIKFYYAAQVAVRPPRFIISCNYPDAVHFSYRRFIMNRLRERFGFEGTPIRLVFKGRGRNKK
jgi:GTP-binding protein